MANRGSRRHDTPIEGKRHDGQTRLEGPRSILLLSGGHVIALAICHTSSTSTSLRPLLLLWHACTNEKLAPGRRQAHPQPFQ
eukprot:15466266-Alexandrium_andersonii.AAC.1